MNKKHLLPIIVVIAIFGFFGVVLYQNFDSLAVLNSQGQIANKQRDLIIFTSLLSLLIVIPVFFMTFWFAWKYREGNTKAKYSPDWDHSAIAETIWWTVPLIMILVLAVITYKTSHELDPFKPISSAKPTLTVQVVALDWKWLFIYPEQQIASLNYLQFPKDTPVKFEITADAPMNSFWIPQLGGQIYAMSGMSTHLNLIADKAGDYRGSSANISGRGFADMHFIARASSDAQFNGWVNLAKSSDKALTANEYAKLARPSRNNPPQLYSNVDPNLYDTIVVKYMSGESVAISKEVQ